MIGRRFAHFEVLGPLGSGGMGEVYRARDTHLDRHVAIKVLPAESLPDQAARARFRLEALALSNSPHPRIAVIHDFVEEGGVAYIVMELIEGEPLEHRIADGPIPEAEIRKIGAQVAEGLAVAHARGIVHRDLKPSNIMITPQGDAKILDFGIAKRLVTPEALTATGFATASQAVVGTLPYMAPEQLRGAPVDARTDLFALGTVLYEMATGHRPFAGATPIALADSILHDEPERPGASRPGLSPALERIIRRCLEKDPARRFTSSAELAKDLASAAVPAEGAPQADTLTVPVRPRPVTPARTLRWSMAAFGALLAGALLVTWLVPGRGCQGAGPEVRSLAVLPLENLSSDASQEFLAEGMTDELIVSLQSIQSLKVISRTSSRSVKTQGLSAPEIGRRLRVDAIVTGSVQRAADRVRIRAELVEAGSDRSLWAGSFERDAGDMLALQNDLARAIVDRIRAKLQPAEQNRLRAPTQTDPRAVEYYLRANVDFNAITAEKWRLARSEYESAIRIAPDFAAPYAGLAELYDTVNGELVPPREATEQSRAMALRAIELDPECAAAYGVLGSVYAQQDYDWVRAERTFRRGLEANPHEPGVLQRYGELLHVQGKFDDALVMFRRAREQDPLSPYISVQALWPLNQGRRYAEAIRAASEVVAMDTTFWYAHFILGQSLMFSGAHRDGLSELELAARLEPTPLALAWLGWARGVAGRTTEARRSLARLVEMARGQFVQPYCFALVRVGLGDRDEAIRQLSLAVEQRTSEAKFIGVDPAWDPIRDDPRFIRMLQRIGLDPKRFEKSRGL